MDKVLKASLVIVIFSLILLVSSCCWLPLMPRHVEPLTPSEKIDTSQAEPQAVDSDNPLLEEFKEGIDPKPIEFNISYLIHIPNQTDKIVFVSTIPGTYPQRQKVNSIQYSLQPHRTFSQGLNHYAEFIIENPQQDLSINIVSQVVLYDYDLTAAYANQTLTADQQLNPYLNPEPYLETDHPLIADNPLVGLKEEYPLDQIKILYQHVMDQLNYDSYNHQSLGAAKALKEGRGDCTEYADALTALCRAAGFPARWIEGYYLHASDLHRGHNWVEVYLDSYGWIPLDAALDDGNAQSNDTTFSNLQNAYLYLSFERNDHTLNYYHFYYYRYWGQDIEVTKSVSYRPTS